MSVEILVRLNGVLVPVEIDEEALAEIAAKIPPAPIMPYLNVQQAADYLCTTKQRIYDLLSARKLTKYKDGNRPLISRDELEAYLRG